jgi:nucleotide-binding universal stress UspA family protein
LQPWWAALDVTMSKTFTVLCPVDLSQPSTTPLRYGTAIAVHFGGELVLLAVDDPLLADAASIHHYPPLHIATRAELKRLTDVVIGSRQSDTTRCIAAVGKPATQITATAADLNADLIVMSSRGRQGLRKLLLGSTTEGVLRETRTPVLVVPDDCEPLMSLADPRQSIHRVLAPVDLTPWSQSQVGTAATLAAALSVPLVIAHVIEPLHIPAGTGLDEAALDASRRADAEAKLASLAQTEGGPAETVVLSGKPAAEIAAAAAGRDIGLIVMGLHSSGWTGPRLGSVTYRVLCLTHSLVLALPPEAGT